MAEAEEKEGRQAAPKADSYLVHPQVVDLLVANIIPTTKSFDSRFDRLGGKLDQRDLHQRNFTIRMFMIPITLSLLGVLGVLLKTFGIV
jgi:hypothetical protein